MTYPHLYKKREAAEREREAYRETTQRIREDADLSVEGRGRRLAEAYMTTKTKLRALADDESRALVERWTKLENSVFGAGGRLASDPSTFAISARDAADRAAQVQSADQAADLLDRAEADGDELLAKAVARHAVRKSETAMNPDVASEWDGVTRSYIDARPRLTPAVEELAEIERMNGSKQFSPFMLPRPSDVTAAQINAARYEPADGES
ncbi:MAG: hypothetical protein WA966_01310 [Ornithinimicrobium sp.]